MYTTYNKNLLYPTLVWNLEPGDNPSELVASSMNTPSVTSCFRNFCVFLFVVIITLRSSLDYNKLYLFLFSLLTQPTLSFVTKLLSYNYSLFSHMTTTSMKFLKTPNVVSGVLQRTVYVWCCNFPLSLLLS